MNSSNDFADLTSDQKAYLSKIDPKKTIEIHPFNASAKDAGLELVKKIKSMTGLSEVYLIGSIALEISGQNDIDVMCFCSSSDFDKLRAKFAEIWPNAKYTQHPSYMEWESVEVEGYFATVYLNDENDKNALKHVVFTTKLLQNVEKSHAYELAKNGSILKKGVVNYQAYMERKYRFINRELS